MIWISLAITIIEFLMKLPDLIDWLMKIMTIIKDLKGSEQKTEIKRFTQEMKNQLAYHSKGVAFAADSKTPIQLYAEDLAARTKAVA